jgi:hypothetical protein
MAILPTVCARLANYLLKDGERGTVAAFYDKLAKVPGPQQQQFGEDATAIRNGRMPKSYQYAMTPH